MMIIIIAVIMIVTIIVIVIVIEAVIMGYTYHIQTKKIKKRIKKKKESLEA